MSENHIENALKRAWGRWPQILISAGIDKRYLTRRGGPCPMCNGEDRFTFDNRSGRGDYICRQCGAGDGISLLRKYRGWSFREAFQHIEKVAGTSATVQPGDTVWRGPAVKATTGRQIWAMAKLWARGVKTLPEDPVGQYLTNRAIGLSPRVGNLRTMISHDHTHVEMLAKVQDVHGVVVQLHRTLVMQGACVGRRMMPGVHPAGSAVRLYEPETTLGIAEGIENALSAACLFQMPVWAALTAGRLAKFDPPGYVERLEIFADHDEHGVGQGAARELVKRMGARNMRTKVHLPPDQGSDWNVLLGAAMRGAEHNPAQ